MNILKTKLPLLLSSMVILLTFFSSCKKNGVDPSISNTPTLSATAATIVLTRANATQSAVTFSWSAGSVSGSTGTLTYFLQWDLKGNNFANPTNIKVGRDTLKLAYTQAALNDLFSTLPLTTATAVQVRIVTATSDGAVSPFYSNALDLTITNYSKVIPPPYTQLWMVGDASPKGWDIGNATPMVEDMTDPYLFTYTGLLAAGEFKIATAKDFGALFYRPASNHPALSATGVVLTLNPDDKWQITSAQAGNYKITLNLHNNTISIVSTDPPKAPYSKLWLLGDATAGGWDLNSAPAMTVSSSDSFVFTYVGTFAVGEFKIATALDFNAPFYRPVINDPPITATDVQLNAGDPDNKWKISTAGSYTITLNLRTNAISIVSNSVPPFSKLWLIGDATPGAWNLNNASSMTVSPTDPFVFTYTGPLVSGEFKIATALDFNAAFYRPSSDHPALSATDVVLTKSPDDKWQITSATAGNYKITINMRTLTISIVKQ